MSDNLWFMLDEALHMGHVLGIPVSGNGLWSFAAQDIWGITLHTSVTALLTLHSIDCPQSSTIRNMLIMALQWFDISVFASSTCLQVAG